MNTLLPLFERETFSPQETLNAFYTWRRVSGSIPFPCGELLREGPSSIALIPKDRPNHVLKIIKIGQQPFGNDVEREFNDLARLQKCTSPEDSFVLPQPVAWGRNPDYIEMTHIGDSIGMDRSASPTPMADICRAGQAAGEFNALVFRRFGLGHMDISLHNLTRSPDGRIGIIDIASVVPTTRIEDTLKSAMYNRHLPLSMAIEFARHRRRALNLADLKRWEKNKNDLLPFLHPTEDVPRISGIFRENMLDLREWEASRSRNYARNQEMRFCA